MFLFMFFLFFTCFFSKIFIDAHTPRGARPLACIFFFLFFSLVLIHHLVENDCSRLLCLFCKNRWSSWTPARELDGTQAPASYTEREKEIFNGYVNRTPGLSGAATGWIIGMLLNVLGFYFDFMGATVAPQVAMIFYGLFIDVIDKILDIFYALLRALIGAFCATILWCINTSNC